MFDRLQGSGCQGRGDTGEVLHARVGDGACIDVGGEESGGRAVVAVVTDPWFTAAKFLDHQAGRCRGVQMGGDGDTFAAGLPGDQGAEGVVTDPADPGRPDTEPGRPDGDIRFGAADSHRQACPAAELAAAGARSVVPWFPPG